jgi:streptogramin lyase
VLPDAGHDASSNSGGSSSQGGTAEVGSTGSNAGKGADRGTSGDTSIGQGGMDGEAGAPAGGTDAGANTSGGSPAVGGTDAGGAGGAAQTGPFTSFYPNGLLPNHITRGPDDNMWFSDLSGKISRITPEGVVTSFPLPTLTGGHNIDGLIVGPDKAFWFTDRGNNQIGRMTTAGVVKYFDPSASVNVPGELLSGPDGNIWGSAGFEDLLFRLTPGGTFTYFPAKSTTPGPDFLGTDGKSVYASMAGQSQVAKVSQAGAFTRFNLPKASSRVLSRLVYGDDGALWFADYEAPSIFKMSSTGTFTEFPLQQGDSPYLPAVGPDDHIWFLNGTGALLRVAYDGTMTRVPLPQGILGSDVAAGANDIWIAAQNSARVARLDISKL